MYQRIYTVYILTNKTYNFYIGFTGNLSRRLFEHKYELIEGYTKRYHIHRLVYFEFFDSPIEGIMREKQLKKWSRKKKIALIREMNPTFLDLSRDWE